MAVGHRRAHASEQVEQHVVGLRGRHSRQRDCDVTYAFVGAPRGGDLADAAQRHETLDLPVDAVRQKGAGVVAEHVLLDEQLHGHP